MSVKFVVDTLDEVSDSLKAAYVEGEDGKFSLDLLKYEEVIKAPLLSKNKELLGFKVKNKAALERAAKFAEVADDEFEAYQQWKEDQAAGGGKGADDAAKHQEAILRAVAKKEKELQTRYTPIEQENAALKTLLKSGAIETELTRAANKHGLMPERHAKFIKAWADRFDVPDLSNRKVVFLDDDGEASIATIDAAIAEIKDAEPWWFAASDKGGSGSAPGSGDGKGRREKSIKRADWERMSSKESTKFFAEGGKIVD